MKIVITNPAKKSLRKHYNYYKNVATESVAEKLKAELIQAIESLRTHPQIGQEEEYLKSLNMNHRYLVKRHYKIIYRVEKEIVYITDFFDTRQDPVKMKKNK
jgi:plasmid stabilization system protein ParE